MKASVVIPNYNGERYLEACLKSLMRQDETDFEVIVVDDGSSDGAAKKAQERFPDVHFIFHEENRGFAAAVNTGIAAAKADAVILLNNDTVAGRHFVGTLVRELYRRPDIFSVSACMLDMQHPERVDDAGDSFSTLGWAYSPARDRPAAEFKRRRDIFSACAGAAVYRKDVLLKLGAFDERHFAYLEDVDLGFRAQWSGWRSVYAPRAKVLHAGSGSSGSRYNPFKLRLTVRNQVYLVYKNMPLWMLIFNRNYLLLGWLIKLAYFAKKGMGKDYLKATGEGFRLCREGKLRRVDFKKVPFRRQLLMEKKLLAGSVQRFLFRRQDLTNV
ncbi:MAG: glycosyltransferase family 2 protein [Lachnospiraceae bacterium]|nr:glycosyltransferase family 2 protein [Lachnospiraceae bacterium]